MKELVVIALALWLLLLQKGSYMYAEGRELPGNHGNADEYNLRKHLRSYYNPDVRRTVLPRFNLTDTVRVQMGMALIKILNFDEESDVISVYAWERLTWTDPNLAWDHVDFSGIDVLYVPIDDIWRPDLVLYNSLTIEPKRDGTRTLAVVDYSGSVMYVPREIYTVYCTRDEALARWSCPFKFGSWVYDGFKQDVDFYNGEEQIDLSDMIQDQRYAVVGHQAKKNVKYYPCCDEPYPDLTFTLEIQRNETETESESESESGGCGIRGSLVSVVGLVIMLMVNGVLNTE